METLTTVTGAAAVTAGGVCVVLTIHPRHNEGPPAPPSPAGGETDPDAAVGA
jgi:hypothetical protein